MLRQSELLSY